MNSIQKAIFVLSTLVVAGHICAADITVHVSGYAEKPGRYRVPDSITVEELSKLFGGAVWGTLKRITIIRLERRPNEEVGDAGNERTQIFNASEITNNKGQLQLMPEDIIYVPMRQPFNVKRDGEQAGTEQPATRPESKSEGGDKPEPEAEGRSR